MSQFFRWATPDCLLGVSQAEIKVLADSVFIFILRFWGSVGEFFQLVGRMQPQAFVELRSQFYKCCSEVEVETLSPERLLPGLSAEDAPMLFNFSNKISLLSNLSQLHNSTFTITTPVSGASLVAQWERLCLKHVNAGDSGLIPGLG